MKEVEMVKYTEHMGLKGNAYTYRVLGGDPEGNRLSARARNRWEESINMGGRGVDYFILEYGRWLKFVSILMTFFSSAALLGIFEYLKNE
jgi:hypothetical protein